MGVPHHQVGPNAEQARQSAAELQNWALWDMVQRQQDYERIQRRREDLRLQFASFLCRRRQELQRLEWEREKDKQFYSREGSLARLTCLVSVKTCTFGPEFLTCARLSLIFGLVRVVPI